MNGKDSTPKLNFIPYSTLGKYEDVMRRVSDLSKIYSMLNYQPEWEPEEGLKVTIDWQKKVMA